MNILEKIIQLPKINIKQLERIVRNSHPTSSSSYSPNKQNQLHSQAIIVASPFYSRLPKHPLKCECHFHRLKKTSKVSIKKTQPKQSSIQFKEKQSQKKDSKSIPSTLRPYILDTQKMRPQVLKMLAYQKLDSLSSLKQEKQNFQTQRSDSESKIQQLQINQPLANKLIYESLNRSKQKKIDTKNTQFVEMLSKRLENDKYKSSYLKTLFSFIKMKTNIDKYYMWNSKAYLSNSLNLLLNHFSIQNLIKVNWPKDEDIQKIAFYMGCQNKQVKPILKDLAQSVAQMQTLLEQIRKRQEKSRLLAFQNVDKSSKSSFSLQGINNQHQKFTTSWLAEDEKKIYSKNNSINDIIAEQSDNHKNRNQTKDSLVNLRKSALKSTQQFGSPIIKTIDNIQNQEKNQKETKQIKEPQENIRNNQNTGTLAVMNRNSRSTVFATINECRGESRQSTLKKTKLSKSRKVKILQLVKYIQGNGERYSQIRYQKFCSKQQFAHLVEQIQRLDQNDQQRAQKMFNLLKVEQFIDNSDKIDEMMNTFTPLFADRWKDKLLKHIFMVKDRKNIQKLSRQLDYMISQVKRTDPRHFNNQDLCPYKQDPILKNNFNQRIICFRYSQQVNGRLLKNLDTSYNEPQKIDKTLFTEGDKNLKLQQADLNEIRAQALSPILTQSIYSKCKAKKKMTYIKPEQYTSKEQNKILKYMHQQNYNTFGYLSSEITNLCNKLGSK